jgi:hypothetical protein
VGSAASALEVDPPFNDSDIGCADSSCWAGVASVDADKDCPASEDRDRVSSARCGEDDAPSSKVLGRSAGPRSVVLEEEGNDVAVRVDTLRSREARFSVLVLSTNKPSPPFQAIGSRLSQEGEHGLRRLIRLSQS